MIHDPQLFAHLNRLEHKPKQPDSIQIGDGENDSITFPMIETIKGSGRRVRGAALRTSRARIQKNLTPAMKDASREIDQGFELLEAGWGVVMIGGRGGNYSGIPGSGWCDSSDMIDEEREKEAKRIIGRLHKWEFACAERKALACRHTVYALNQLAHSEKSFASLTGFTQRQVMAWYSAGLQIFCDVHALG